MTIQGVVEPVGVKGRDRKERPGSADGVDDPSEGGEHGDRERDR